MRILILGLNYRPESTSIGPYTADLAEYLVEQGHQVQVLTGFPMAPQWRIWDGYRGRWFQRETINGVPVRRSYLYVPREPRRARNRGLFDGSFVCRRSSAGCWLDPAMWSWQSPPIADRADGWLLGRLKRAPLLFHIQDLVPDAAVATGMLSESSRPVKIARWLERFVYRRAGAIGVICDGFRRNLLVKRACNQNEAIAQLYRLRFHAPMVMASGRTGDSRGCISGHVLRQYRIEAGPGSAD